MRVLPFIIPRPTHENLIYDYFIGEAFYDKLHSHTEFQISYIESGEGTLVLGDSMESFQAYDIFILGSNLPHVFRSDTDLTIPSVMHTLFFSEEFMNSILSEFSAIDSLHGFISQLGFGIKYQDQDLKIFELIQNLKSANKLELLIYFLNILNLVSKANFQTIANAKFSKIFNDNQGKRLSNVFDFLMNNFQKDIKLEDVANLAFMTKEAFCRYFKQKTNKTFLEFLIELRIEHACKLLLRNSESTIAEIAERSGFQNISNFNRTFKTKKNCLPSEFRRIRKF
jgi:AraC-like DNA-binding protein